MFGKPKSVSEAIKRGVPEEEAELILAKLNELVKEGKWIPLHIESPREAHSQFVSGATSIISYWGPKEFLKIAPQESKLINYIGNVYAQISSNQAEKRFRQGILAKSHELIVGSAYYPTWICPICKCRNLYVRAVEREVCQHCKLTIPEKLVLTKEQKSPSTPPLAGRIIERHWEIWQMHYYMKKNKTFEWFLGL